VALARGVVHEAYAQPVDYQPQPAPVVPNKPPDPLDELPPKQKPEGADVQWLPGYWAWDEEGPDYVWVSGCWRNAPPDRQWVPGAWQEVEGGWMWSPGFWAGADTQEVVYVDYPPAPAADTPPGPAPQPTAVFAPGSWVWREERWFWRPGYWVTPEPGWVWVMDRYVWTPSGRAVFVEGYWDWALERRGLLFAPVRIHRRSKYVYAPDEVVLFDSLLGTLFVGPGRRHYHFGDYSLRKGFVEFAKYHPTPSSYDPLYDHYRQVFRNHANWELDFRKHARSVPALTPLARAREESVSRLARLAPAAKLGAALAIKTRPVRPEERTGEKTRIEYGQHVAEVRRQHEGRLLAQAHPHAPTPPHPPAAPHPKPPPLVVPHGPAVRRAPVAAPAQPPAPTHVARPVPPPTPPRHPGPPRRK
jgi:hypothetical protein